MLNAQCTIVVNFFSSQFTIDVTFYL